FMVVATQNPMEYQGTYPLPESQLDRFMMRIRIGYPSEADEKKILQAQQSFHPVEGLKPVLTGAEVVKLQDQVVHVRVDESLVDYLLAIVTVTRQSDRLGLGASTRAAMSLHKAAQALAFVEGREYCLPDDFKYLAPFVLSHRVIINARLDAHGYRSQDAEEIITDLVDQIPVPL
ncbi:MAG TPA: MoxR family ATPase, partial [Nitrospiria bacterium]|nr:MoxR family ATPase [Nitrospiria bacterium]